MASELLGRAPCPLCDFTAAHVKRKTDPAPGKAARPYLHCPECGLQLFTLNDRQASALLAKLRPEGAAPPPAPSAAPAAAPAPAAPKRRAFSDFIGVG